MWKYPTRTARSSKNNDQINLGEDEDEGENAEITDEYLDDVLDSLSRDIASV